MANNYIAINLTSPKGAATQNAALSLATARDALALIKTVMDNMINAADYSILESAFGIPTGKGLTVYNLVSGSVADINNSSNVTQLITWLGVTR